MTHEETDFAIALTREEKRVGDDTGREESGENYHHGETFEMATVRSGLEGWKRAGTIHWRVIYWLRWREMGKDKC